MANSSPPRNPYGGGEERSNSDRGRGFGKFEKPDTYIAGRIVRLWIVPGTDRDVVTIEVDEITIPVFQKGDDTPLDINKGDLVNISLDNVQLKGTITPKDANHRVFILYKGSEPTKSGGTLKLFFRSVEFDISTSPHKVADIAKDDNNRRDGNRDDRNNHQDDGRFEPQGISCFSSIIGCPISVRSRT